MKKSFIYSSAFLATLALASCSSNEVIDGVDDTLASSGQVIEISVENAGNGLESRAGRPLYSSEAAQDIDNVKVVVVNDNTGKVAAEKLIKNWMSSEEVIAYNDASGHGRKIRIEIPEEDKLGNGNYTIYAIGYSEKDDSHSIYGVRTKDGNVSSLNNYLQNQEVKDKESGMENLVLVNKNDEPNKAQAEEIFAGSAKLTVANNKCSQGVTLHRQVAGIFTYVENIPYWFNNEKVIGTKLQLVAAQTNTSLVLGNFYDKTLSDNGNIKTDQLMNVVNGTDTRGGKEYVVYTIELSNWFKELKDVNNDGFLDRYEYKQDENGMLVEDTDRPIWKNAIDENQSTVKFKVGSVFGSSFIIPFQKVDGTQTFELRLIDDNGTPHRTWKIGLPADDWVKTGTDFTYWDNNGSNWTTVKDYNDSKENYSVLRNHLYGIGKRDSGNTPDNPGKDPDEPQDLNTKQDIMLQVNDNWEVIHQMEVE